VSTAPAPPNDGPGAGAPADGTTPDCTATDGTSADGAADDGAAALDRLAVPAPLRPFARVHLARPDGLQRLAEMLSMDRLTRDLDQTDLIACAMALRRAAPGNRMVWKLTNLALYNRVPSWHWAMVNDLPRNDAFEAAIAAAVRPGMTVLDIGAGTGLLSMMAARAGADRVYAVEMSPHLAMIARECIAANGYDDRITLIEMHSSRIEIGTDMPRRADLLIHEVLSTTLLDEGVIPTVAHARDHLLTPEAPLLPERIWAVGQLASAPDTRRSQVQHVNGFDLSALNVLAQSARALSNSKDCPALSDPAILAAFDLREVPADLRGSAAATVEATAEGTADAVLQWLGLGFPDGTEHVTTHPTSSWGRYIHPLGRSLTIRPGERVALRTDYLAEKLAIGLA